MADEKNNDDFRYMVRVKQTDLDGKKQARVGLTKVKGVGKTFANAVCNIVGIDSTSKLGYLSESDLKKVEDVLDNPSKHNIPSWLFNRRKDYDEGVDKHLFVSDLDFTKNNDLRRLQKTKSYRGLRLQWGLTVRGQRTKAHFRKRNTKGLGVKRKK